MTALGVWGTRDLPDMVKTKARAPLSPGGAARRALERGQTNDLAMAALRGVVSATEYLAPVMDST